MKDYERRIRVRGNWLNAYHNLGSITKASTKLGISRSTLCRWIDRYSREGKAGASDKSRRPKKLANQKLTMISKKRFSQLGRKRIRVLKGFQLFFLERKE
jgi:transposase